MADVLIVICMVYTVSRISWSFSPKALIPFVQLQQAKTQTYFVETKDLLSKLTRQTMQTGLLATIVAVCELGFYLGFHEGSVHTGP